MSALQFGSGNTGRYFTLTGPSLPAADWAIGAWFRMDNMLSGANGFQYLLSSGSLGVNDTIHLFVQETNSGAAFVAYATTSAGSTPINAGPPISWPRDGTNYLAILQRRGANYEIYCVPKGATSATAVSGSHSSMPSFSSKTYYFGARGDLNSARYWLNPAGELFFLTNDSLSNAEVISLAAGAHIDSVRTTRAVDLRFRDNNATEPDLSGNSRNATRYGTGYSLVTDFFAEAASGAALDGTGRLTASASAVLMLGQLLGGGGSASSVGIASLTGGLAILGGSTLASTGSSATLLTSGALASSSRATASGSGGMSSATILSGSGAVGSRSMASLWDVTALLAASASSGAAAAAASMTTVAVLGGSGSVRASTAAELFAGSLGIQLSGSGSLAGAATAAPTTRAVLTGSSSASSTSSPAQLFVSYPAAVLTSSTSAAASASAAMQTSAPLSGSGVALASASVSIAASGQLASSVVAGGDAIGSLATAAVMSGSGRVVTTTLAELELGGFGAELSGDAAVSARAVAALTTEAPLFGSASVDAFGLMSGDLALPAMWMASNAIARASSSSLLQVRAALIGSGRAASSATQPNVSEQAPYASELSLATKTGLDVSFGLISADAAVEYLALA